MLSFKKLNAKRRRKEIKRQAKRKAIFLKKCKTLKGRKERLLKAKAMRTILSNPELLQKYIAERDRIKAEKSVAGVRHIPQNKGE
jgi:hypothetical protein